MNDFYEDLKNDTGFVCNELKKYGEVGEAYLEFIKSCAEYVQSQEELENAVDLRGH